MPPCGDDSTPAGRASEPFVGLALHLGDNSGEANIRMVPMLTERQTRFAHAYIDHGGNGHAAALYAGYAPTTAAKRACENLKNPDVAAIVSAHREAAMADLDGFDVVKELKSLYRRSIAAGHLAVAHNTLATLARVAGAEAPQCFDIRHMSVDEMDREIRRMSDIIGIS